MGSVHQVTFGSKRDELSVAEANLTRALRQVVEAKVGKGASFDDLEATTLEVTNETGRSYLGQVLQELSDSYDKELLIDGVHYKQSHQQSLVHYHSLLGPLHVERATYRQAGQRGGLTLVPLELEAGIVEGATPALGYSIALGYAQQPSRHYVEQMKGAYRNVPSRATVERIGKAIGAKAKEAAPRIETYLRRSGGHRHRTGSNLGTI